MILERKDQLIQPSELITNIENDLDFDFSVGEKFIIDMDDFEQELLKPFLSGSGRVFYRGERINDPSRPLLPTILRNRRSLFDEGEPIVNITSDYILDYYNRTGFPVLYNKTFGCLRKYHMYEFLSFSQHYYNDSPLIDFTKSLYVALSFALKGRESFEDDCIVYTVSITNPDHYTNDMTTAECWLNELKITVVNTPEEILKRKIRGLSTMMEIRNTIEAASKRASPTAKLIDIPTNDLMKYQQGVFLLLDNYSLVHKSYLTKNIRDDFRVTKYIISKNICRQLVELIDAKAPWYDYDCLLDIKKGIAKI